MQVNLKGILKIAIIAILCSPAWAGFNQKAIQNQAQQLKAQFGDASFNVSLNKRGAVANMHGFHVPLESNKKADLPQQAKSFLTQIEGMLQVPARNLRFKEAKNSVTANKKGQLTHVTFEQMHEGTPVFGRQVTVHIDAKNSVHAVTGNTVPFLSPGTLGNLGQKEAYKAALAAFGPAQIIKNDINLVVFYNDMEDRADWAWAVELNALGKGQRFFIDTHSGDVLKTHALVFHESTSGSGYDLDNNQVNPLTMYRGNDFPIPSNDTWQQVMGDAQKGTYNLVDTSSSQKGYIYTLTSNNTYFNTIDFVRSSDNSFDSTGNSHASGTSAHSNFRVVVDYYKNKHNRNGVDNAGMPIIAIVDLGDDPNTQGREDINAFWQGSLGFMAFGTGSGQYSNFAGGLDVIGHELTHGVTDRSSGLVYENQSGAMNEALSDMFGYLIERFARGNANWELGEEIVAGGFRNLKDPNLGEQPDYVGGQYYREPVSNPGSDNDNGWVHINSGIPNKVFYLLVQGDTHRGITVAPFSSNFGTSANLVGQLMYVCNTGGYFTSTTNFEQARSQMLAAAASLWPSDQAKQDAIKNAWASVNVGDPASTDPGNGTGDDNLQNGVTKSNLSGSQGSSQYFTIEVPAGASNLQVVTNGGSGDGDLYVKFNGQPTTSNYDQRSWNSGNGESISIASPSAGTYHVLVHAYNAFSGMSLTASYDEPSNGGGGQTQTTTVSATLSGKASKTYSLPVSGGVIDLSATWSGSRDIDLYLTDPNGNQVAKAESVSNPEVLSYDTNGVSGTYQIRVFNYSSSSTTYDLTVTWQN